MLAFFLQCKGPVRVLPEETPVDETGRMEKANTFLVVKDEERISGFIERMDWDMQQTETGLWVEVLEKGDGIPVEEGRSVIMDYKVSLLDGRLCYSSDEDGQKIVVPGFTRMEAGLKEGLLLLNEGGHARFIIPPHLAWGLIGDENRIPARSILLYEVWVIKVKNS